MPIMLGMASMPVVALAIMPVIASAWRVCDVTEPLYSAVGDGVTSDTAAIRSALANCDEVVLPAGRCVPSPFSDTHGRSAPTASAPRTFSRRFVTDNRRSSAQVLHDRTAQSDLEPAAQRPGEQIHGTRRTH